MQHQWEKADVYLISSLLAYSSLDLHILIRFKKLSIGHRNPAIFLPWQSLRGICAYEKTKKLYIKNIWNPFEQTVIQS